MKKIFKSVIVFLLLFLTSCRGIVFENQKIAKAEEFTRGEAMIFVVEEKNKYEGKFGSDLWNLKSGDGSQYFKDYVVSNVKKFVESMMSLKLIADKLNIVISVSDTEKLKKAAEEYEKELSLSDIDYMDCNSEDILRAFTDFHLARLTVDNIAKGSTPELSISEAKVIKVQYIVFDSKEKAEETLEALKAKGANFSYFAKTRSLENTIEMVIQRGDDFSTKFPELFYLSTGQVSQILYSKNNYYVFKCIEDYMVDETENRRLEILRSMKNETYNIRYEEFRNEYQVKSNSTYWKDINLSDGFACKIYKFEEIYYRYFPKNIV